MADRAADALVAVVLAPLGRDGARATSCLTAARRAIDAREQFLAMLGHELRNPLAAIRLATELLERRETTKDATAKYAASVERQTNHLSRLVDDLLDVARVTSGKVSLQRERV